MKYIKISTNPNGILNQPEQTIFTHLAPALYFADIKRNQDFEIIYNYQNEVLKIGIAKVEEFQTFPASSLTEGLSLIAFGYPRKSVFTILKHYPNFDMLKNNLIAIFLRWKEKRINGVPKIHVKKS